ncbi:MAG: M1 family metallopeptidase [Planctomycetes bacterium]|nr:M1 family metallopeptidase [Planctomycetota bacterium]MCB9872423.1 M1 family metallopeptidase [Planctomycetota bacterium]
MHSPLAARGALAALLCSLCAATGPHGDGRASAGPQASSFSRDSDRRGPPATPSRGGVLHYAMRVQLDVDGKQLRGTQRIRWRNSSGQGVRELRFHMYLNAFRDRDSTFMVEAGPEFRRRWRKDDTIDEFGWIELNALRKVSGSGAPDTALPTGDYIAPDDQNDRDKTVLRVRLPQDVPPGGEIELATEFTARLPRAYRRTGWAPGEVFFVMHWFPKLGVLTGDGDWNCHQFHANTEFFAEFCDYEVEIVAPEHLRLGATGARVGLPQKGESPGTLRHVYRQDRVHDFAFVASARHRVHEQPYRPTPAQDDPVAVAVAGRMGVSVSSFDLPPTRIILMLLPEHDTPEQRSRHFGAVQAAIDFFGHRFGPYPYPTITLVDPCRDSKRDGATLGGGMEYPNLITCGTPLFPHRRQLRPEGVVTHEFGHQYWYGLSGNNEFEEAWLDEGINTYSETRALMLRHVVSAKPGIGPVQTTSYGPLCLAAKSMPRAVPGAGLDRVVDLLPRPVRDFLQRPCTWLPDLPLVELVRDAPLATFCREASYGDMLVDRARFLSVDDPDPMVLPGWRYLGRASYVCNSYHRPATILNVVERMVGRDRWWHFLRQFHSQARFAQPTTEGFVSLLEKSLGAAPAEFFRRAIAPQAVLDYGVESVRQEPGGPATVVVRRFGSLVAPVTVRFRFAGRSEPEERWIPAIVGVPWRKFVFDRDESGQRYGELEEVWVDPPHKAGEFEAPGGPVGVYLNDANLLNNAWRKAANRRPVWYRGIRHLLQAQGRLSHVLWIG